MSNVGLDSKLAARAERELRENILPFWMNRAVDHVNGGFYGAVTNDLQVVNSEPRSAVVCARILWTFSAAYRLYGDPTYLAAAQHAHTYLTGAFWDNEHSGIYWTVDHYGAPGNDRKHTYAQAFAMYGLSEFYRATGEAASLSKAQELFRLIEMHAHDSVHGGYIECRGRAWDILADMRLSAQEPNAPKSMNTLLHILEAYTNLRRVWADAQLAARHRELI